jgi:hypothetical protein
MLTTISATLHKNRAEELYATLWGDLDRIHALRMTMIASPISRGPA